MTFHITEPHPRVTDSTSYINAGRGGAGNLTRYNSHELTDGIVATGPASKRPLPPSTAAFTTGRGGAGNSFKRSFESASSQRIFRFDEELAARDENTSRAPIYHIGRGGAGNKFRNNSYSNNMEPTHSAVRNSSASSAGSVQSAASSEKQPTGMAAKLKSLSKTLRPKRHINDQWTYQGSEGFDPSR